MNSGKGACILFHSQFTYNKSIWSHMQCQLKWMDFSTLIKLSHKQWVWNVRMKLEFERIFRICRMNKRRGCAQQNIPNYIEVGTFWRVEWPNPSSKSRISIEYKMHTKKQRRFSVKLQCILQRNSAQCFRNDFNHFIISQVFCVSIRYLNLFFTSVQPYLVHTETRALETVKTQVSFRWRVWCKCKLIAAGKWNTKALEC